MNKSESKLLLPEELANKNSPSTVDVLTLSLEYMLAGMAKEYCKATPEIKTVQDFNSKNKFNWTDLLAKPFFISTSNSNSESLYSLFGDFYTQRFGPTSLSIYHLIKRDNDIYKNANLKYFEISYRTNSFFQVDVLDADLDTNFELIQEKIKEQKIRFEDQEIRFEDICILNDDKVKQAPLYKNIEKGINIVSNQSLQFFSPNSDDIVVFKASYFDIFNRAFKENKFLIIPYNEIKTTRDKPFIETSGIQSDFVHTYR